MNNELYVCQLPQSEQEKILDKARKVFETLAYKVDMDVELENVRNSKVKDVTHIWEEQEKIK